MLSILLTASIFLFGYAFSVLGGRWGARAVTAPIVVNGHYSSELVGIVETAIYTTAWLWEKELFIPVWLGLKVAGHWGEMKVEEMRPVFNRWLVGNSVSLVFGVAGGVFIQKAIADEWLKAIGAVATVALSTLLLAWRSRALAQGSKRAKPR